MLEPGYFDSRAEADAEDEYDRLRESYSTPAEIRREIALKLSGDQPLTLMERNALSLLR